MVERLSLQIFVAIAGPLVLASYVAGIMRASDPEALWGGVSGGLRTATIPWMFVAAAGFLIYAYFALFSFGATTQAQLRWPWGEADGAGSNRLLWAYAVYLIPSMLWLESTLLHLEHGAWWSQALTIGVLTLVSVGVLMLGAIGWAAAQDGVPGGWWMVAGAVGMGIQSILNDNVIWVWKFPW